MKIVWTRPAVRQLAEAREYIEVENPRAASRLIEQIQTTVNRLRVFPLMGRPGLRHNTRELVVSGTPYVVIYQIQNAPERVVVIAVIHGATDWQSTWKLSDE